MENLKNLRQDMLKYLAQQNTNASFTTSISSDIPDHIFENKTTVEEKQKVYRWMRVYLQEEYQGLEKGDKITFTNKEENESVELEFAVYNPKSKFKYGFDQGDNLTNYSSEKDYSILCIIIDEKKLKSYPPSIRSMFPNTPWYKPMVMRKEDLEFKHGENKLLYTSVNF